ncbi:hypothetical protein ACFX15_023724 [Malus domestica]
MPHALMVLDEAIFLKEAKLQGARWREGFEERALSDEVKLITNSFSDPAVLNTIQLLRSNFSLFALHVLDEIGPPCMS